MKVTEKWRKGVLVWFSPDHPDRELLLDNVKYQEAVAKEMALPWFVRLWRYFRRG